LPQYFSLSFGFSIFPVAFRGTLDIIIFFGLLYLGRSKVNFSVSSTVKLIPSLGSTIASAISPNLSSGIPITATSFTLSCFLMKSSI
jgi:hypothetical protein